MLFTNEPSFYVTIFSHSPLDFFINFQCHNNLGVLMKFITAILLASLSTAALSQTSDCSFGIKSFHGLEASSRHQGLIISKLLLKGYDLAYEYDSSTYTIETYTNSFHSPKHGQVNYAVVNLIRTQDQKVMFTKADTGKRTRAVLKKLLKVVPNCRELTL